MNKDELKELQELGGSIEEIISDIFAAGRTKGQDDATSEDFDQNIHGPVAEIMNQLVYLVTKTHLRELDHLADVDASDPKHELDIPDYIEFRKTQMSNSNIRWWTRT